MDKTAFVKRNVSIKHIAGILGISTVSVSLVLSGRAGEGRVGR
jgi:predicted transcriptional regulator